MWDDCCGCLHYYASFTRDPDHFEANLARLKTPVKVMWGSDDLYVTKDMGTEFAERIRAGLNVLAGIGHYPHLHCSRTDHRRYALHRAERGPTRIHLAR